MSPLRESPGRGRRFTERLDAPTTILEAGVTIRGTVSGRGGVELGGAIEGDLESGGLVHVRPGARIAGRLIAAAAVVEGAVEGDIQVAGTVELRAGCQVLGDLVATSVAIADGALFDGRITMAGASTRRDEVTFRERRQPPGE